MAGTKAHKSDPIARLVGPALGIGFGMTVGVLAVRSIGADRVKGMGPCEFALTYALLIALFSLAAVLHIAIHEAGHLVAGLATGYRFSSYRLFSLMLLRRDGRYEFKRLSVAGTGGQCLMAPPDLVDGRMPYVLYNLGGVTANLVVSLVCGLVLLAGPHGLYLHAFLASMVLVGLYMALVNGIPLNLEPAPNDGWNALNMGKDASALRAFWAQLAINAAGQEGTRLKDMPSDWFVVPEGDQLRNGIAAGAGVFAENRLMDAHDFAGARALAERLRADDVTLPGLYRHMLACDLVYLDLLERGPEADLAPLGEREVKSVLKQMRDFPSVLRTTYAVALLHDRDATAAAKIRERFERVARTYPSEADIASERELMALAAAPPAVPPKGDTPLMEVDILSPKQERREPGHIH